MDLYATWLDSLFWPHGLIRSLQQKRRKVQLSAAQEQLKVLFDECLDKMEDLDNVHLWPRLTESFANALSDSPRRVTSAAACVVPTLHCVAPTLTFALQLFNVLPAVRDEA